MNDLNLADHEKLIENLIGQHIDATFEIVESKKEIDGKLGRSYWGSKTEKPKIVLPKHISVSEIDDSLVSLAMRGQLSGNPKLGEHADEIDSEVEFLKHLVFHEIAHIKNNWEQDREVDCDLWVYDEMHKET